MRPVPVRFQSLALLPAVVSIAASLGACGKATVRQGPSDPGFSLASLRGGSSALIVSGDVRVAEFRKSFDEVFGTGDGLAARLSARILDSLTRGDPPLSARAADPGIAALFPADAIAPPAVPAAIIADVSADAGARVPDYIVRVRGLAVGNALKDIPSAILPSVGQNSMAPAGGGTSESCVVSFDVEVWETGGAGGLARRAVFTVTGRADVVLYAYKSALVEAVNAAARAAARHLRGS